MDQVRDQVGGQVWGQVWDQVRDQVWDQVWDQVGGQVRDQELEYFYPAEENVLTDNGWVAFYDYFSGIGIVKHDGFTKYMSHIKNGIFYTIFLKGAAILCGRPEYIKRDESNRLHCEDGPAILWMDGYAQYFWHGVSVTQKIVETPEQLTREDLVREENAEVRRAMMEKLDSDFIKLLDVIEVDRGIVGIGDSRKEAVLWRTREIDSIANEYLQFVGVTCHSTGREYALCIPSDIKDVWSAVAWTFGKSKDEYRPLVEA